MIGTIKGFTMKNKSHVELQNFTPKAITIGLVTMVIGVGLLNFPRFSKFSSNSSQLNTQIYIAYQLKTKQVVDMIPDLNHKFSQNINSASVNVDILKNNQVLSNSYGPSSEGSIEELNKQLHLTPSDDRALIKAINRVKKLLKEQQDTYAEKQDFSAFIVSEGSKEHTTLEEIRQISQEIADKEPKNFHLYLIGVNPDLKIEFSAAFEPIKKFVQSCSYELPDQCSFLIDGLEK
jgi:hypothetical protein